MDCRGHLLQRGLVGNAGGCSQLASNCLLSYADEPDERTKVPQIVIEVGVEVTARLLPLVMRRLRNLIVLI